MENIKISPDQKLVKVIAAQAKNERVESDKAEEAAQIINELVSDFTPHNRYQIAQLMAYTLNELQHNSIGWLQQVADVKNIGFGDKAQFKVPMGGITALIQAKGATTPRSKVADKTIILDTVSVSSRPAIDIVEFKSGRKNMADLIREANRQMENEKLAYIQTLLYNAIVAAGYVTPYFVQGAGVLSATLDPMITHFQRYGGVALIGDIAVVQQLPELTGFDSAAATLQFSNNIIDEFNNTGLIGTYRGAKVISMVNAYQDDGTTPILDAAMLYILPVASSPDNRNMKVVNEGAVFATESQSIDDLVYEVRLDQFFGAGLCVGNFPTMGLYEDQNL